MLCIVGTMDYYEPWLNHLFPILSCYDGNKYPPPLPRKDPISPRSSVISWSDSISGENQYFQIQPISVLSQSINWWLVFSQRHFSSDLGLVILKPSDIWSTSEVNEMMALWSWFITIFSPNSPNCFAISHFGFMLLTITPPSHKSEMCFSNIFFVF